MDSINYNGRNNTQFSLPISQTQPSYKSQLSIRLTECEDKEAWQPGDEVLSVIDGPKFEYQVIYIAQVDNNSPEEVLTLKTKILQHKQIGLVVMGPKVDRHHHPNYICLVAGTTIYAMDPERKMCLDIIKELIHSKSNTVWTTQGLNEADTLFNRFGIDIAKAPECNDVLAIHLCLMDYFRFLPESCLSCYPTKVTNLRKNKLLLENFPRLAHLWLDIPIDELDIPISKYIHLSCSFPTTTTTNIILKRCSLVLILAKRISDYYWSDNRRLSNSFYRRFTLIEDDYLYKVLYENYLKKIKSEKELDSNACDSIVVGKDSSIFIEAYSHLGY